MLSRDVHLISYFYTLRLLYLRYYYKILGIIDDTVDLGLRLIKNLSPSSHITITYNRAFKALEFMT